MMEKLFNLLERFVVAVEKIAQDNANPIHLLGPAERGECCGMTADKMAAGESAMPAQPNVVNGSTAPEPPDYSNWERDAVISECEKRGIDVPARTRTATLVGQLEEFDKGWRPNPQPEPTPEPVEDPFAETQPTEFKYPSVEDARAVLRRLMVHHGNDSGPVTELIKKHAGVEKIVMVPPDKFQAIMDEAEEMMKGEAS